MSDDAEPQTLMPEADAAKLRQAWADIREVLDRYADNEGKAMAVMQVLGRAGAHILRAL
jgi:hypothetical protein